MNKDEIEKRRKERISEALRRYYISDKGLLQRNDLAARQKLRMDKYGEYLKAIDNNNGTKTKYNEKDKM